MMTGRIGRALAVIWLAVCMMPLAHAACTQDDLEDRLSPALQYRLRCLDGLGRLDVFRVAATPHTERISAARLGNASAHQVLTVMCR
ncbi:MAG: hypothetical protein LBM56_03090, partial [Burkholderiaceae bacterium]|nr:hypothetical protein [Burkholderiaceae bacterium]